MSQQICALVSENFPPKSKFAISDTPDLSSKTVIVTGGSAGLGKETVKHLLTHNAKVYIAARNREKVEAAIRELQEETGKTAILLELDLASLRSVNVSAEQFLSKEDELHILFNNGGVMTPPVDTFFITSDGYDLQFGVNVLGHFYFTKLLLPALIKGAASSSDGASAFWFSTLDYSTLRDGPARIKKGPIGLYSQSKFGIVSTSLTPGVIKTDLQRHLHGIQAFVVDRTASPVSKGVLTQLYAGTHPEGANLNGKYLMPYARVSSPRPETLDEETGKRLWDWLEEQVKHV